MKPLHSLIRLLVFCLALGGLSAGCRQGISDDTSSQSRCQLQQIVSTTTRVGASEKVQTQYTYDAAGNLLQKTVTNTASYSAGGGSAATTTETYAYSTDNFLTHYTVATNQRTTDFTGKVSDYQLTLDRAYTYASNRLASYTSIQTVSETNLRPTPPYVTTNTYEYDGAGQLLRQTLTSGPASSTATWTYHNGLATAYALKSGATELRPLTLQNGLVIQARYAGVQNFANGTTAAYTSDLRYEYDAQRRLIKQQEVVNDTLKSYFTQTWQAGAVAPPLDPVPKGHPLIQSPYGENGVLATKKTYFVNKQQNSTAYPYLDYTYAHQLNAQGLIATTQTTVQHLTNGSSQPDLTTTVYTYGGCK